MSTERICVVGPKTGVDPDKVTAFLHRLHRKSPDCVVVSGGLRGVDEAAESCWLGLGGRVVSFRPYQLTADSFCVQELGLFPLYSRVQPRVKLHTEPTWADFNSAVEWCLRLIICSADRVVAFMPDGQQFNEVEDYCVAEQAPYYAGARV